MTNPLVSICIPTYNGAKYIVKCINSCLLQTYQNFEIVVCDDCSTDNTLDLVNEFAVTDERIKVYRNEQNFGLVENWNATLDHSEGQYIKWLFQDDWIEPDALEQFVAAANMGYDFIISKRNFILSDTATDDDKDYFFNRLKKLENHFQSTESYHYFTQKEIADFSTDYIALNFIAEPSLIFFKKSLVNTVGLYDNLLHQICDLEYNIRLASVSGIYVINKPLCHFAIHSNSTTNSNISQKYFQLRFIEQAYFAYKLLKDASFSDLRKYFSFVQRIKLSLYYNYRMHEAKKYIIGQEDKVYYQKAMSSYEFLKLSPINNVIFWPVFKIIDLIKSR